MPHGYIMYHYIILSIYTIWSTTFTHDGRILLILFAGLYTYVLFVKVSNQI